MSSPTGGNFLPPANEVCEGYVFTRVCQSFCSQWGVHGCRTVHGWGACVVAGVCMDAGGMHGCRGCAWLWGVCGCGGHAWLQGGICGCRGVCVVVGGMSGIWRDTVNERALGILLECILVCFCENLVKNLWTLIYIYTEKPFSLCVMYNSMQ